MPEWVLAVLIAFGGGSGVAAVMAARAALRKSRPEAAKVLVDATISWSSFQTGQLEDLQEGFNRLRSEVEQLRRELADVKAERDALRSENTSLKAETTKLRRRVNALENEVEALKSGHQ